MTKRWFGAVFIVLGLSSNAFSMQYTLETITYPDAVWTGVSSINNKGHVAGTYSDGTTTHGYIYDGNSFTTVDFPGAVQTSIRGINDSGKVVGWYNFNGQGFGYNRTYGFLYDNVAYYSVAFTDEQYGIPDETSIYGINNKDVAVGGYWAGGEFGFTYDKGVVIADKFYGYGVDINDNGDILVHTVEPGMVSWVIGNDDFYNDFINLENVPEIVANGMNNLGQVVGELYGYEASVNFIYDGEFKQLDLPGIASDINDSGQIVGNAQFAYIATPSESTAVPEPSSIMLLGLAIGGIFSAHRFSRGNTGSQLA